MENAAQTGETVITKAADAPKTKQRIQIIDAVRGLAIILMVIHHALYDAAVFFGAPWWVYRNAVFTVLQAFFIGVFIIVSGISSRFSRNNTERGAYVFVIGIAITYVTARIMNMPIYFGILHLLGVFMMFYGITRSFWDKLPMKAAVYAYITLTVLSALARVYLEPTSGIPALRDILSVLGWRQFDYVGYDYQTVFPWIFIFLLGTRIGEYIKDGKMPQRFYSKRIPFFPAVGRNALIIYVLHQPVLFAVTQLLLYLQR